MQRGNLWTSPSESLPPNSKEEIFDTLISSNEGKNLKVERIVSCGQTTDGWYNQDQDEWVVLIQGEAELELKSGDKEKLNSGDYIYIPKHTIHRVSYTSQNPACVWLAIMADQLDK
eukprot:gb/GECH01006715.1/.p1 GENE.gb/GECH01006715.1/~~gb/GECH01006715.1/.p1  ORF type:complete len:116 (+),score=9.40 gb/GECH01006715.1/:1-348(+)